MITVLILPSWAGKKTGTLGLWYCGWSSKWSVASYGHHGSTHWLNSAKQRFHWLIPTKRCFFQAQCIAVWSHRIFKALKIWRRKCDVKFGGPDWNKTDKRLITGSNQASSTALCACASKWPTTNNQEMGGCCISYFSHLVNHFKIIPRVIFSVKFWQKSTPSHWTKIIRSYVQAVLIFGINFL